MKKRFLLPLITLFIAGIANAQNCIQITRAIFSNPSSDGQTWQLDYSYITDGNKALQVYIYCDGNLVQTSACLKYPGGPGAAQMTGVACSGGLSKLKAVFVRWTGNCGAARCGDDIVVPGDVPLGVQFESVTAAIAGGNLQVNWRTGSEENNKEFVVEGSADGKVWTALGKLESKGVDGNAAQPLDYSLLLSLPASFAAIGLGGFLLLTVTRSRWMRAFMILAIVIAAGACAKNEQILEAKSQTAFIRIAQYDKNGAVSYSKVVKVMQE
ncbi:MAG: hypothetical protein J7599_18370 [Niabella sp.]|nr:hypothetical protein [Niabella sp.]